MGSECLGVALRVANLPRAGVSPHDPRKGKGRGCNYLWEQPREVSTSASNLETGWGQAAAAAAVPRDPALSDPEVSYSLRPFRDAAPRSETFGISIFYGIVFGGFKFRMVWIFFFRISELPPDLEIYVGHCPAGAGDQSDASDLHHRRGEAAADHNAERDL